MWLKIQFKIQVLLLFLGITSILMAILARQAIIFQMCLKYTIK